MPFGDAVHEVWVVDQILTAQVLGLARQIGLLLPEGVKVLIGECLFLGRQFRVLGRVFSGVIQFLADRRALGLVGDRLEGVPHLGAVRH